MHGFDQTRKAQIIEAIFARLNGDIDGVSFLHDKPRQSRRDLNHFINTDTTLVTAVAINTTHRPVKLGGTGLVLRETFLEQGVAGYFDFLLAIWAELACQALGDDQVDRGGDIERRHPHIAQAR